MCSGQRFGQRVELDDLGSGCTQQLSVLGISEAERLAGRQRDGDVTGDGRGRGGLPRFIGDPAGRHGGNTGKVDVSTHQCRHRFDCGVGLPSVLDGGDQTEMP